MTEQQKQQAIAALWVRLKMWGEMCGAFAAFCALIWIIGEPHVRRIATEFVTPIVEQQLAQSPTRGRGTACATIPRAGHDVEDGRPGQWVKVVWRDVQRHRDDCGTPELHAYIRNGNDILHSAELSLQGIAVPAGTRNFSYLVRLPEQIEAGNARLQVIVGFPEAVGGAPEAFSPWWPFNILPPS